MSDESDQTKNKTISNEFIDLTIENYNNLNVLKSYDENNYTVLNYVFALVHIPGDEITLDFVKKYGWTNLGYLYGLMDESSLESSGILKLNKVPTLNLKGSGVIIGIVDTGIEYTHSVFKQEDNTTRILSIWDQTIDTPEKRPAGLPFGTEYSRDLINKALASNTPFDIVPSTDSNGHGTMLAGIAAGSYIEKQDFIGVAPLSDLVIVKLKPAKENIRKFYIIPDDVECYQSSDIQLGVRYLEEVALKFKRPLVICLGVGTSQGGHGGRGPLGRYLSLYSQKIGTCIVVPAGNEGNRSSHYYGVIDKSIGYDPFELHISENSKGFSMELWGAPPNVYSVDILSPSGEFIPKISARIREDREIKFLFERTILYLHIQILDDQTANERILFRFNNPASGIWRFRIYGSGNLTMRYHIWLPIHNFIDSDTYFIKPDPNTSLTSPGNVVHPITTTAYDHINNSIYLNASRGYNVDEIIKPDIAAPGVNVYCPGLKNSFTKSSGSSIATAQVAGAAALLLEWGILNKNIPQMDTQIIKRLLVGGAKRDPNITYPNREWGYGILDLYNTFLTLRGE